MAAFEGGDPTLRDLVRMRIKQDVIGACSALCSGWMVLVLDATATRVVTPVLGMYDLMEERVTLVESLEKKRQPFTEMEVVYIVAPTPESVQRICADFDAAQCMYGDVHIFFLSPIPDELMGVLGKAPLLVQRLKTLKELNLDFLAIESQVFHLDMPGTYTQLCAGAVVPETCHVVATRLATVCITSNEFPLIRYKTGNTNMSHIAQILQSHMEEHAQRSPTWWFHGQAGSKKTSHSRSTLLLVDRADDPLTPMMHEYTYQAMVNDLLDVNESGAIKFAGKSTAGSEVFLNENDELWVELRHEHIAKVIETLGDRVKELSKNAGAKLAKDSGANLNLTEMADAMKKVTSGEYQEMNAKLSKHLNVTQECMKKFQESDLMEISRVEQNLATGVNEEGHAMKPAKALEELLDALQQASARPLAAEIRSRLIAIYAISQRPLSDDDAQLLVREASLTPEEQALLSQAVAMTTRMPVAPPAEKKKFFSLGKKGQPKSAVAAPSEGDYSASRYVCPLREVVERLAEDKLSASEFPCINGDMAATMAESKPVVQSARQTHNRYGTKKKPSHTGGRIILFVVGGCSDAEKRSVYEVTGREVMIGATAPLSSRSWLAEVAPTAAALL